MMVHISEPVMLTCVWLCAVMILYALSFYRCFLCLNDWLLSGVFGCNAWAGVSSSVPAIILLVRRELIISREKGTHNLGFEQKHVYITTDFGCLGI